MLCQWCGTDHPDTANFCGNCGAPVRQRVVAEEAPRQDRWEYQDLVIPLNFSSKGLSDEEVVQRYEEIVRSHLERAADEGWEADHPTDFQTVWAAGGVKWRAVGVFSPACMFDTASLRLRCLRPGAGQEPGE